MISKTTFNSCDKAVWSTEKNNTHFKRLIVAKKQRCSIAHVSNFFNINYSKHSHNQQLYNHIDIFARAISAGSEWMTHNNHSSISLPKKLVRDSFLKHFANHLPLPAVIKSQTLIASIDGMNYSKNKSYSIPIFGNKINTNPNSKLINRHKYLSNVAEINNSNTLLERRLGSVNRRLMKAEWIMQDLIDTAKAGAKKNLALKRAIGQVIRQAALLIDTAGTQSPIQGLQISIIGRITNKKKAMAKKFTRSVGRVPLSSLNQPIDYSQRCVKNRFGTVGVKVWVCYQ